MSREEAATFYLKGLLGFRGDFRKFHEAVETLSESDRSLLEHAASRRIDDSYNPASEKQFFRRG